MKRLLPIALLASGLQGLLLYWGVEAGAGNGLAAVVCLALLGGALYARHWQLRVATRPIVVTSSVVVTGSLGGLGMMLGGFVDSAVSDALPLCHAAAAALGQRGSIFNWMNGLMLAFCVLGCRVFCSRCDSRRKEIALHIRSSAGMLIGMVFLGQWLGPRLQGPLGAWEGMHVAMLLGMMIGAWVVDPSKGYSWGERRGKAKRAPI